MSEKFALIIANTDYADPALAKLSAPGRDAKELARVLKSPEFCGFNEVNILFNRSASVVSDAIDVFFSQKKRDDLLVLYFSGHGIRDEQGVLYLAVKNTNPFRLRTSAIKSEFIRESMDQSHSKRQVLILDCCNSGAFAYGTKAFTGGSAGTASAFEGTGFGHVVLTASDSTQFAWEGDQVIGETRTSLFTHFLVKGLEGEADIDGDGRITINELYDYSYEQIVKLTPKQTPSKWSYKEQGEIILRENMRVEDIKPASLPPDLIDEIDDTRPYVREAAVQKLEKILKGRNIGLARSAREALEKIIADDNTTRRTARTAASILESVPQSEIPKPPINEPGPSLFNRLFNKIDSQISPLKQLLLDLKSEVDFKKNFKTWAGLTLTAVVVIGFVAFYPLIFPPKAPPTPTPSSASFAPLSLVNISLANNYCKAQDYYVDGKLAASILSGTTSNIFVTPGEHTTLICNSGTNVCGGTNQYNWTLPQTIIIPGTDDCFSSKSPPSTLTPVPRVTITLTNKYCQLQDYYVDDKLVASLIPGNTTDIIVTIGQHQTRICNHKTDVCGSTSQYNWTLPQKVIIPGTSDCSSSISPASTSLSQVTITVTNNYCKAQDYYVDGSLAASISPGATSSFIKSPGRHQAYICNSGTNVCGGSTQYNWTLPQKIIIPNVDNCH